VGSFVTLEDLREEVGNDAARFFYIMRQAEQHMDFDLDLAKSKTNENPRRRTLFWPLESM
jgi:arginyl-tRNA synthetase